MKTRIISLAISLGLIAALIVPNVASAAALTGVSDSMDTSAAGASAVHTVAFTTTSSIVASGTIEITFPSGFDISAILDTDVSETLQGSDNATWADTGQVLIGTIASTTVTAGVQSVVIGSTNKVTNHSTASTYTIQVVTKDDTGAVLDTGYCLIDIGAGRSASVTVKTLISATITDNGNSGINFGAADPGTSDVEEEAQNGVGAVTVVIGSEVNVTNTYVKTKCDDWSGGGLLATHGKFADTGTPGSGMTTSYQTVGAALAAGGTRQVYHWLTIPANTTAGTYTTTYYYQVTE